MKLTAAIVATVALIATVASRPAQVVPLDDPAPATAPRGQGVEQPEASPPTPPAATLTGTASWYGANGLIAAAGPALRVGDWRGSRVRVAFEGRSVTVTLSDFCQCYGSRLIDLSDDAFARLAPLSRGLIRVTIGGSALPTTPPTDMRP